MNLPRLTYEQSKRAYELGFRANTEWWFPFERITNQPIHCLSHNGVTEDLFANPENVLFLQWCRSEKLTYGNCTSIYEYGKLGFGVYVFWFHEGRQPSKYSSAKVWDTHHEAETALIDYLLAILEKKTK